MHVSATTSQKRSSFAETKPLQKSEAVSLELDDLLALDVATLEKLYQNARVPSLDALHGEEGGLGAELIDLSDVGMIELGDEMGFAPETGEIALVGSLEELQRHDSAELGVAGLPDLTHPSLAQEVE